VWHDVGIRFGLANTVFVVFLVVCAALGAPDLQSTPQPANSGGSPWPTWSSSS
jgi:hypothetical protein